MAEWDGEKLAACEGGRDGQWGGAGGNYYGRWQINGKIFQQYTGHSIVGSSLAEQEKVSRRIWAENGSTYLGYNVGKGNVGKLKDGEPIPKEGWTRQAYANPQMTGDQFKQAAENFYQSGGKTRGGSFKNSEGVSFPVAGTDGSIGADGSSGAPILLHLKKRAGDVSQMEWTTQRIVQDGVETPARWFLQPCGIAYSAQDSFIAYQRLQGSGSGLSVAQLIDGTQLVIKGGDIEMSELKGESGGVEVQHKGKQEGRLMGKPAKATLKGGTVQLTKGTQTTGQSASFDVQASSGAMPLQTDPRFGLPFVSAGNFNAVYYFIPIERIA